MPRRLRRLLRHPGRALQGRRGMYTNKAPGGVAYRVLVPDHRGDVLPWSGWCRPRPIDLGMDQAEFRRMNFMRPRPVPPPHPVRVPDRLRRTTASASTSASKAVGYEEFLRQQAGGEGQRPSCSASASPPSPSRSGAGNSREYDILGIRMADSAELQVHMTGKADRPDRCTTPGPGARDDLGPDRRRRARHPGRRHRGRGRRHRHRRRSAWAPTAPGRTPVAGAAVAMVARKIREPRPASSPRTCSRSSEEDIEWELGRFYIRSAPDRGVTIQECAMAALQQHAGRHGAGPGEHRVLRPAQPDLAVRGLHRHRRGRPRDRGSGTC